MRTNNIIKRTLFLILLSLVMINAQAQTGLNFQGVARTSNNVILASQAITIKLSILQGSTTGTADYTETRKVITNAQGLFTVVIGDTGAISTLGNFTTINWKLSPKFLKIEMDPASGTKFVTMGTTQFQYVAYAQFAKSVDAENILGIVPVSLGGTGVSSIAGLKTALTLNNVNNTADLSKPISTLTQTALDLKVSISDVTSLLENKVDKVVGKNLSTNDYTTAEKEKLAAITGTNTVVQDLSLYATTTSLSNSLASKVDKVSGKDLSTNDFSTTEKNKLASITGTNTGDQDLSLYATTNSVALKENQSNKSTDALLGGTNASDILFPTQKAVKDYVAANSSSGGVADGGITNIKIVNLAVTDSKIADVAASKITGTLGVSQGGTGATTLTGIVKGNGTSAMTSAVAGTDYQAPINLTTTGSGAATLSGNTLNIPSTTNYTLPTASSSVLGGVKVGTNLIIDGSGVLNADINGKMNIADTASMLSNYRTGLNNKLNLTDTSNMLFNYQTDIRLKLYKTDTTAMLSSYLRKSDNASTATLAGNITATTNTTLTSLASLNTVGTITSGTISLTTDMATSGTLKAGAVTYPNTHGTSGQVLTSLGSGTLTWTTASSGGGSTTHTIGESYGGGKVFYVYDGGLHGLIVATTDQSAGIRWYGGSFTNTRAVKNGINGGISNTDRIIINQGAGSYAAQLCANYNGGNYADWYLPSKYELNLLYDQKTVIGGGANLDYWSSTEYDSNSAWVQNFSDGDQNINFKSQTTAYVRAIRSF